MGDRFINYGNNSTVAVPAWGFASSGPHRVYAAGRFRRGSRSRLHFPSCLLWFRWHCVHAVMAEPDSDEVLAQFNRLIEELVARNLHRSTFRPWEIGILVDLDHRNVRGASKRGSILRGYQNAVQCQMKAGARFPLKLSEYLESLEADCHRRNRLAVEPATGTHEVEFARAATRELRGEQGFR